MEVTSAGARLYAESRGSGAPVTVVAHGLGGTIPETRALASGVDGTTVFLAFRGHAPSVALPGAGWTYADLAGDLRAVADATGATRCVSVSMGASAALALLAETPDRFERCVFFLPGALDRPRDDIARGWLASLAGHVEAGDVEALVAHLATEVPAPLRARPDVIAYLRTRASLLAGTDVAHLLRGLPGDRPVADRVALSGVTADCLVIGQEGDPVHPASIAREVAAALPKARLVVLPSPGGLWAHRMELRRLVTGFLNG